MVSGSGLVGVQASASLQASSGRESVCIDDNDWTQWTTIGLSLTKPKTVPDMVTRHLAMSGEPLTAQTDSALDVVINGQLILHRPYALTEQNSPGPLQIIGDTGAAIDHLREDHLR